MSGIIFLDTGVLGQLVHPRGNRDLALWLEKTLLAGATICIPEIADYELRRKLIHRALDRSVKRLDQLERVLKYIPISSGMIRLAAVLWAEARRKGHVTAPPEALDGDVILAAQAQVFQSQQRRTSVLVATDNVGHLAFFVDARTWEDI